MATYYSNVAGAYDVARSGTGLQTVAFEYAVGSAFFTNIDDVLILCKLPPYATLLNYWIDMPDCGTSGAADLGTLSLRTRFKSAVTIVTAATWTSFDITGTYYTAEALPFKVLDTDSGDVTAADDLRLTCTTGLTAQATTKTIKGFCQYLCNQAAAMAEVAVAVP